MGLREECYRPMTLAIPSVVLRIGDPEEDGIENRIVFHPALLKARSAELYIETVFGRQCWVSEISISGSSEEMYGYVRVRFLDKIVPERAPLLDWAWSP